MCPFKLHIRNIFMLLVYFQIISNGSSFSPSDTTLEGIFSPLVLGGSMLYKLTVLVYLKAFWF